MEHALPEAHTLLRDKDEELDELCDECQVLHAEVHQSLRSEQALGARTVEQQAHKMELARPNADDSEMAATR